MWHGLGFATKTVVRERFKCFEGKLSRAIMQGATKRLCFSCSPACWALAEDAATRPLQHFSTHLQACTSCSPPPCCMWFNPYWWAVKTEAHSSAARKKVPPATCTLASSCYPLWQPPWPFSAQWVTTFHMKIQAWSWKLPPFNLTLHTLVAACCQNLLCRPSHVPTGHYIPSKFSLYPFRETRGEYITTAICTVNWLFGVWTDCNILKHSWIIFSFLQQLILGLYPDSLSAVHLLSHAC